MSARSEVILSKPSDWADWYEDFVARAETSRIIKYVDIDQEGPELVEPQEPMTSEELLAKLNRDASAAWMQASQANPDAAGPRPEPAEDLTNAQWNRIARLQAEYKVKIVTYSNYQRAYADLAAWVRSTVDKTYLGNTSSKSNLRTIIRELKSSLAPTDTEQFDEARLRYRQVLSQTKRVKPEDWIVAWNKARLEGEKHKIPELQGYAGTSDFLTAVTTFDPAWAKNQIGQVAANRKRNLDSGFTLREPELFQEEVRRTRAAAKLTDSVFAASGMHDTSANSPCPCGLPSSKHSWKAKDCAAVQIAVNGASKDGRQVRPTRLKICKEAVKLAKWKSLVDAVKESGGDLQQTNSPEEPRKRGDFVGVAISAECLSDGTTESVFAALQKQHPLYNSTIYDGGATTHVVNNKDLLADIREASESDHIMIGDSSLKIQARGTRRMEDILDGEDGKNTRALVLLDVAYVPRFHTNLFSAKKLEKKGLWHCGFDNTLRMGTYDDNDVLCRLTEKYDLKIVEYKPVARSYFQLPQRPISVFNAFQDAFSSVQTESLQPRPRRRIATSRQPPPPRWDSAEIWHRRACHAGPKALEQLVLQTRGVRIKGPTTAQCTACGTSKATEIISRRESPHRSRQPFYRVFVDIFGFSAAYNGHRYILLMTDEYSGMMFFSSMPSKAEATKIVQDFDARIKRHTGASLCKIRVDNERALVNLPHQRDSEFQTWAAEEGMEIELPPPHTKEPTGGAERPGGINQTRMRSMGGLLPLELWPEFYRAAVWIHNILPSEGNKWMSPKEKMDRWFHQHFRWYRPPNVDFDATKDHRPHWCGIYAYGCKAYPLNPRYKAGKDTNLFKLSPRAHVGYLVGYHASNIYRIWVPKLNRVILTRDVRFNEEEFFDPEKEDQLETERIAEYAPILQTHEPLPTQDWDSILNEFLFEFDQNVLGISPEGSNSGVDGDGGTVTDVAETVPRITQSMQTPSQRLLTPLGESTTTLPTPDPTPQLARRDASPAQRSDFGSDTLRLDPALQQASSSPAQRTKDGPCTNSSTSTPDPALQQTESSPAQRTEDGLNGDPDNFFYHASEASQSESPAQSDQPTRAKRTEQAQRSSAPSPEELGRANEPEGSQECEDSQGSTTPDDRTSPTEVIKDTIVCKPLPPPGEQSVQQQSDDQPTPATAQSEPRIRRRRHQRELYGEQPTRKSARTPKPNRKTNDYAHSVFTALLPTDKHPEGDLATFHSVFLAAVSKAARDHRFHRDDLVRLPKRYQDLENHPKGPEFKEAIRKELRDLLQRGTWRLIEREKAHGPPLPLKWVFTYKFDQDGYLQRCKARICVRGDLQEDDDGLETYAATLAAKTFRIAMATAAGFDLDIRQFDVGNAFLYSDLNKDHPI
ncbi:hypothetical protein CDD83_8405 [Cordyceps sp. RAO-2017]|nr:hypothetical protein CDD83_8405 [Cordyceps sp. RAO-2017]